MGVDWLYPQPPLCLICRDGRLSWRSDPLCAACLDALPRLVEPLCERCGQPVGAKEAGEELGRLPRLLQRALIGLLGGPVHCQRCRLDPPPFRRARAVASYRGWIRAAIHRLKYRGEAELALPLGRLMGLLAREELLFLTVSLVVPVPLHPDRLASPGVQSE